MRVAAKIFAAVTDPVLVNNRWLVAYHVKGKKLTRGWKKYSLSAIWVANMEIARTMRDLAKGSVATTSRPEAWVRCWARGESAAVHGVNISGALAEGKMTPSRSKTWAHFAKLADAAEKKE